MLKEKLYLLEQQEFNDKLKSTNITIGLGFLITNLLLSFVIPTTLV